MKSKLAELNLTESDILDETLTYLIKKAREEFYVFVQLLAPEILPEEFIDGRHIKIICDELQAVADSVANPRKKPQRLQLFLPPGSMKSKLASNLFPAWCLGKHPNWCFLAIGGSTNFAVDNLGRPTKDIVDLEHYKAIFPDTELRSDVNSAGRWDTTKKGRFVVAGVGTGIAGRRAHISICDDVVNEQTGNADRKRINSWYQKGLRTRLLPKGAEVVINTRWHLDDLSGHLMQIDGYVNIATGERNEKTLKPWRLVSIPALCTASSKKLLWREGDPKDKYDPDTSFWPEFWPTDLLREKREEMLPHEWNALYMQSPTPEEGNIVKREDWQYWEEDRPPPCKYIIVSADTAFSTNETADYSAYTIWGAFQKVIKDFEGNELKEESTILLGAAKGHWDFATLCEKIKSVCNERGVDFLIIEDRASGQSLIQEMRKLNLPVVPYRPEKDKRTRLNACTPYFKGKRVYVPKNKLWAEEVMEEVCTFPMAPNDDYTDTVSQAIMWLRDTFYLAHNDTEIRGESYAEQRKNKLSRKSYWSSAQS